MYFSVDLIVRDEKILCRSLWQVLSDLHKLDRGGSRNSLKGGGGSGPEFFKGGV